MLSVSHADPRTAERYDRTHTSLDRHATDIVAAYFAVPPVNAMHVQAVMLPAFEEPPIGAASGSTMPAI